VTRGGGVYPLAFSPDGRFVAGRSFYWQVMSVWEVATGKPLEPAPGHDGPINLLVASPDGRLVVSAQEHDPTLRLWDAATGRPQHVLHGHRAAVVAAAFSPDGKLLASGGNPNDRTARLWDVATGKELRRLPLDPREDVTALVFAPDGRTLAGGTGLGSVCVWDVGSGGVVRRFQAYPPVAGRDPEDSFPPVTALAYSPDGKLLATASQAAGPFRVWAAATGTLVREFPLPKGAARTTPLAFSADGRTLVTRGTWETVSCWEVAGGGERHRLRVGGGKEIMWGLFAFGPEGRTVAWSVHPYDTVHLWDTFTGRQTGRVQGHRSQVTVLGMLPDGPRLLSGSRDTTVLVWQRPPP
jgi:WD40 repeat protein